jgi:hypothetical protein
VRQLLKQSEQESASDDQSTTEHRADTFDSLEALELPEPPEGPGSRTPTVLKVPVPRRRPDPFRDKDKP